MGWGAPGIGNHPSAHPSSPTEPAGASAKACEASEGRNVQRRDFIYRLHSFFFFLFLFFSPMLLRFDLLPAAWLLGGHSHAMLLIRPGQVARPPLRRCSSRWRQRLRPAAAFPSSSPLGRGGGAGGAGGRARPCFPLKALLEPKIPGGSRPQTHAGVGGPNRTLRPAAAAMGDGEQGGRRLRGRATGPPFHIISA